MTAWLLAACARVAATRAEDCGACHADQQRTWAASLHASGVEDPVYAMARGEAFDPAWCDGCHLADGTGVGCVSCHVQDDAVLTARAPTRAGRWAHRMRVRPELGGEDCGACHQFDPPPHQPGAREGGVPLQDTVAEWRAWGGDRTCADCHFGEHGHLAPGAHDPDLRARALSVAVRWDGEEAVVRLSGDAGHAIPTGDAFHRVEVAVGTGPACGAPRAVVRFGRHLELGEGRLAVVEDTRIPTGERAVEQRVRIPAGADRWCARYLFAEEAHLGRLAPDGAWATLGTGGRSSGTGAENPSGG